MLTRLIVRNFKRFDEIDIELGDRVVLIGPNNCGKTTALQAIALWDVGLRRWSEKKAEGTTATKRTGVTINRRDLISIPVPDAKILWRNRQTHKSRTVSGKPQTDLVNIEVIVEGVMDRKMWSCGMKFYFATHETFYCRPLRHDDEEIIPKLAQAQRVAYLPPMSGLAAVEPKWEPGRINVLIGEGQTAQVLRNLCHDIAVSKPDYWEEVKNHIERLFGAKIDKPVYISERGEIAMTYSEHKISGLDISASGRGLQQTLLLLAYLYANPNAILLLDEPDAHLEILRQRQTYQTLTQVAQSHGCQVIAASHSEVILNEAAGKDVVIGFIGRHPRRMDNRASQLHKSLRQIGYEDYMLAEQEGCVLYLEGSTDLEILRQLALKLNHSAQSYLERPFVCYVGNQPSKAMDHFQGLRIANPDLQGVAIFDRLKQQPGQAVDYRALMWRRREIENYICSKDTLIGYAKALARERAPEGLFVETETERYLCAMEEAISERVPPAALKDETDPFWYNTKASDEFLDLLFPDFFNKLGLPNLIAKTNYHVLADCVPSDEIDSEIIEKLDAIVEVASNASVEED